MSLIAKAREQVQQKVNPPARPKPPAPAATRSTTTPPRQPVKAVLTDDNAKVVFQFNPETIKIGHQPDTKPMNRTMGTKEKKTKETVVGGNPNEVIMSAGEASISFSDIVFDGPNVIKDCAQLLKWTYPIQDPKNASADHMVMPILYFSWNDFESGLKFLDQRGRSALVLAKVDVSYVRFDPMGAVTRAKVNLSCKIPPSTLAPTNPTSGGPPARTGHLVTAGEDLPGIARANYGSPGYWRQLAQLNGIDDPLRVRPGQRLFVPGRAELPGGAR